MAKHSTCIALPSLMNERWSRNSNSGYNCPILRNFSRPHAPHSWVILSHSLPLRTRSAHRTHSSVSFYSRIWGRPFFLSLHRQNSERCGSSRRTGRSPAAAARVSLPPRVLSCKVASCPRSCPNLKIDMTRIRMYSTNSICWIPEYILS